MHLHVLKITWKQITFAFWHAFMQRWPKCIGCIWLLAAALSGGCVTLLAEVSSHSFVPLILSWTLLGQFHWQTIYLYQTLIRNEGQGAYHYTHRYSVFQCFDFFLDLLDLNHDLFAFIHGHAPVSIFSRLIYSETQTVQQVWIVNHCVNKRRMG